MIKLSKSKYTSYVTCPKQFWLKSHKPELAESTDASLELRFEQGNEAGDIALRLFDGLINAKTETMDGKLDILAMCEKTRALIASDCPAIAEAAFSGEGVYCAVDILKNNGDGSWDVYEVKSSTSRKLIYLYDIAFQRYVLTSCGIKVRKCKLVYINNQYIRQGEIEPHKLFNIEDVSELLDDFENEISENLKQAQETYESEKEPPIDINESCNSTYPCAFYKHCSSHVPEKSVFNLYRLSKEKKFDCYRNGIISFEDIRKSTLSLNEKQQRQVDFELDDKPQYVDRPKIREFLSKLKFPLYFLDFETYQTCLPLYDGLKPYQQIPFQYSLHILRSKSDEALEHKEFLADESRNEWRAIAERLVKDIPKDGGSVISYNAAFENTRIKEMANAFPDLKEQLFDIIFRMVDLLDVFRGGYFYNKEMEGKFSIKKVLPALCPNNPALNYKSLEVNNGMAATAAFLSLSNLSKEERERTRKALLMYCGLDTLAMVVIYKELCIQSTENLEVG